MDPAGFRLRQARERLGLTYRDVERASMGLAATRGRPEFILHISRLADIENRNVVPNIYKLYSVSVIYHLSVSEISSWYEAPFQQAFQDGVSFPSPRTHLSEFLNLEPKASCDASEDLPVDTASTGLLEELPPDLGCMPGLQSKTKGRYRYGYIGLSDRRMTPVLRPGSMVLVDTQIRKIEDNQWKNEYDRPIYFVELRGGYRCGWFYKNRTQLIMQPHTLSHCPPEAWRYPEEAEVVGRVVGVVTYLSERRLGRPAVVPTMHPNLNGTSF
jgi:transcriptional regulator with XRE-family HTH domain